MPPRRCDSVWSTSWSRPAFSEQVAVLAADRLAREGLPERTRKGGAAGLAARPHRDGTRAGLSGRAQAGAQARPADTTRRRSPHSTWFG